MFRQLDGLNSAGSTAGSFIKGLKELDESAWEQYDEIYGAIIERRYVRAGADPDLAAELAQQVMVAVHNGITKYEQENFRGWLWVIAKRILCNQVRDATKPDRAVGGSDVLENLEELSRDSEWERDEDALIARAFLASACDHSNISEPEREVYADHLAGNTTAQEAADKLKISIDAWYTRKSRLLAELKRLQGPTR